MSRKF